MSRLVNKSSRPPMRRKNISSSGGQYLHNSNSMKNTKTINALDVANLVLELDFEKGQYLACNGVDGLRHFGGKHWTKLSVEELQHVILKRMETSTTFAHTGRLTSLIEETLKLIRLRAKPLDVVTPDPAWCPAINCRNGEVWINGTGDLNFRPHDPASGFDHVLDVDYNPKGCCPTYDRALTGIFSASSQPRKLARHWHEVTGYLIQPDRRIPLILVGWGAGGNGKTSLVATIQRLLGPDHVAAMPVGDLTASRFAIGNLAGKRLLLDDDVAANSLLPDGLLKTLSEAKCLTGERKFKDHQIFKIEAVPLLLCNSVPALHDRSVGFRRRLHVIPFERSLKEGEIDRDLFPRIHADELSGVLNRALAGLQRVIQRGWRFDPPAAVDRATERWCQEATRSAVQPRRASRAPAKQAGVLPTVGSPSTSENVSGTREDTTTTHQPSGGVVIYLDLGSSKESCVVKITGPGAPIELCVKQHTGGGDPGAG